MKKIIQVYERDIDTGPVIREDWTQRPKRLPQPLVLHEYFQIQFTHLFST